MNNYLLYLRCRACDDELTDEELHMTNPHNDEPEDFCKKCIKESYIEADIFEKPIEIKDED